MSASISGWPTSRKWEVKSRSPISSAPVRIRSRGTKNDRTSSQPTIPERMKSPSTASSIQRFSRMTSKAIPPSRRWIATR